MSGTRRYGFCQHGHGGQVLPLMAVAVLLAAVMVLMVARTGALAADHARARTAADAAALAGVVGGESAARQLADANGARLERFARHGPEVTVDVRVRRARASARARPTQVVGSS
ncbi:MAG: hypothetical protein AB7L13_01155 [Acidimicrobiia bacterium]